MTKLEAILAKAATKPQGTIKCRTCGGTGIWGGRKECFCCNNGRVPNKWASIATDARSLQNHINAKAEEFAGWIENRDEAYIGRVRKEYQEKVDRIAKRAGI